MHTSTYKKKSFIKPKSINLMETMKDGMQKKEKVEIILGLKRPLAVRALRRSTIRKRIAEYLFDIRPSYSYTSEIAYHIRTTPSNVIGALHGRNTRYKKEESLLTLELVEERQCGKNVRVYAITDFGIEMLKSLNK